MTVRAFRSTPFGVGVSPQSLGVPAAAYPGRVATSADLIVAVDRQQTRLALPLNSTDTQMTVTDPSVIVAYNLLSIDNEIVKTTGPAAGNVVPISRAFDGTAAATHLASSIVSGFIDAYHHNALVAEVQAIEQTLGANLSKIPVSPFKISSAYDFPAQAPGGNLIVGANVITIAPVPGGVNGSATDHYLYISGGTGAAEAAKIIGGTAVSGAASGTVIVQCANTHSGAWTVRSATAGVQEALNTASTATPVLIPSGLWDIYAPITLPAGSSLSGTNTPAAYAFLQWHATTGAAMINLHNPGCTVKNLYFLAASGTFGAAFDITASAQEIMSVYGDSFAAGFIKISNSPFDIRVTNFQHFYSLHPENAVAVAAVINISNSGAGGGGGNYWFSNFKLAGGPTPSTNPSGIQIRNGSGMWFQNGYVANLNEGVALTPAAGDGVANINFDSVDSDSNNSYGYRLQPFVAGSSIFGIIIRGARCIFNTAGGMLLDGNISVNTNVLVSDSEFADNKGHGIALNGANLSYINLHDNYVFGNGFGGAGTSNGIASDGIGSHIYIHHNRCGGGNVVNALGGTGGSPETQLNGITLGGGAGSDWQIANNNVQGNVGLGIAIPPTGTGVIVRDNPGYNPIGPSTLPITASPCTLPATPKTSPSTLYLAGGTVSSVTRGGFTVATSSPCAIALEPGQQCVVTYTVAPTTATLDVR